MQAIRTSILVPSSSREMSVRARSRDHTATVEFDDELGLAENHRAAAEELVGKGRYTRAEHGELVGAELADGSWAWVPALSSDSVALPEGDPQLPLDEPDHGGVDGVIDGTTGFVRAATVRSPRADDPGAFEDDGEDEGDEEAEASKDLETRAIRALRSV